MIVITGLMARWICFFFNLWTGLLSKVFVYWLIYMFVIEYIVKNMKDGKTSKDNTVFALIYRKLLALYYWYVIYSQKHSYIQHTHRYTQREREKARVGKPPIFILLLILLWKTKFIWRVQHNDLSETLVMNSYPSVFWGCIRKFVL